MTTYTFQKIGWKAFKKGKCAACGKHGVERTKEFYQTLNPWNRNADGELKSRDEIRAELRAEDAAWMAEPVKHARCES